MKLFAKLSGSVPENRVGRAEERELRGYRQFYQTYPQIRESLTPELTKRLVPQAISLPGSIRESATPESALSGNELIIKLSFTPIARVLAIEGVLKESPPVPDENLFVDSTTGIMYVHPEPLPCLTLCRWAVLFAFRVKLMADALIESLILNSALIEPSRLLNWAHPWKAWATTG